LWREIFRLYWKERSSGSSNFLKLFSPFFRALKSSTNWRQKNGKKNILLFTSSSLRRMIELRNTHTKNKNFGIFWKALEWNILVFYMAVRYFYGRVVYFMGHLGNSLLPFGIFFLFWYVVPRKLEDRRLLNL
jgi:hypothetical protein